MANRSRGKIGAAKRFQVLERDMFTCQYCGAKAPHVCLEIDHIIPVSDGGDNSIGNLVTACEKCNQGKSDSRLSEDSSRRIQGEMLKRHVSSLFNVVIESDDYWGELIMKCLDDFGYMETAKAFTKSARVHDEVFYIEEIESAINDAFKSLYESKR